MITSTANAQVKALSKLIKNARARRQQQLYVVEGIRMFRETPKERIGKVYVSESFAKDPAHEGVFEGTDWEMLSDSVFAAVSDTKTPQGVLCLVKMKENRLEDMLEDTDGVWLVLENVQDPGNLGTMFRTGEGAGISGVIMDKCTVDIYNPKTIRSTMGMPKANVLPEPVGALAITSFQSLKQGMAPAWTGVAMVKPFWSRAFKMPWERFISLYRRSSSTSMPLISIKLRSFAH